MPLTRSPLKRRTPLKSRPRVSPPDVRKALAARSDGLCEASLPGCLGSATDVCHRVGRAQGGADTVENTYFGCRICHSWTHEHVEEARDLGLILRSWQRPELEPMAYRSQGWVLLGEEVAWL